MNKLKVSEIFFSIQGESSRMGIPTVFVRLTGCPLRCQYCDTSYAFSGGGWHSVEEIIEKIKKYQTRYITVTGGEPLAQADCIPLLARLCDQNYRVSLETSGAMDISKVDHRVMKVMDIKTPASKQSHNNLFKNIDYLTASDEIKFVICDRDDYEWSKEIIHRYQLTNRCVVLFSASFEQLKSIDLAEWILADQLPVRFQLQMHKYIWGDVPGK